jgi:hypothetical protein
MRVLRYFAFRQVFESDAYPPYIRQSLLARIELEKPELLKELQQTDAEWRQQIEETRFLHGGRPSPRCRLHCHNGTSSIKPCEAYGSRVESLWL